MIPIYLPLLHEWSVHKATDVKEDPFLSHNFKIVSFKRQCQSHNKIDATDTDYVDGSNSKDDDNNNNNDGDSNSDYS